MTHELEALIADIHEEARRCHVARILSPSAMLRRAADALQALDASASNAAKVERLRIAADIRHIGPDFDADEYVSVLESLP